MISADYARNISSANKPGRVKEECDSVDAAIQKAANLGTFRVSFDFSKLNHANDIIRELRGKGYRVDIPGSLGMQIMIISWGEEE